MIATSHEKTPGHTAELIIGRLTLISSRLSGWCIFAMMLLVTAGVLSRRLLQYPLVFSDEYSGYLMVFCVFLGGSFTLRQNAHIRVNILVSRLKPRRQLLLRIITSFLSLIFCGVLFWQTVELVIYYRQTGQAALSILETPTWIPALIVPLGLSILFLQIVLGIAQDMRHWMDKDPDLQGPGVVR